MRLRVTCHIVLDRICQRTPLITKLKNHRVLSELSYRIQTVSKLVPTIRRTSARFLDVVKRNRQFGLKVLSDMVDMEAGIHPILESLQHEAVRLLQYRITIHTACLRQIQRHHIKARSQSFVESRKWPGINRKGQDRAVLG